MKILSWLTTDQRSARKSLLLAPLILLSVCILLYDNITDIKFNKLNPYTTSLFQLSAAVNSHLCHSQHFIDPSVNNLKTPLTNVQTRLFDLPKLTNPQLSLSLYCAQQIFDVNTIVQKLHSREVEEGLPLYWLDQAIIALFGNITLYQLVIICAILQIILIGCFTFYLLTIGIRWPTVWVLTFLAVLINTNPLLLSLNAHAFILPCILFLTALYGLSIRFGIYRRIIPHSLLLILLTTIEFWLYYIRSSQLFIMLAIIIIYCLFLLKHQKAIKTIISLWLIKGILIVLFSHLATLELGPKATNASHPVAHMLILGLANPVNAFASQQHITWQDKNSLQFAQKIDPKATILYTPEYNRAIAKYYLSLWQNYPHEMLALYNFKFYYGLDLIIAGLTEAVYTPHIAFLFYPFMLINGYAFIAALALIGLFALLGFWRTASNFDYLLLILTGMALLSLLEGIVIISAFRYATSFIFYFFALVYVFWGTILSSLWQAFIRHRNMPKPS